MKNKRGMLLLVMTGILTLMLMLAVFFVTVTRVERKNTTAGTDHVRAKLLARSGMEYAMARMSDQPDPQQDSQDDWRYREDPSVPLERSINPSYHAGEPWDDVSTGNGRYDPGSDGWDQATQDLNKNGRYDGWSGRLRGTYDEYSNRFSLRIEDAGGRIHINDGILTAADTNGNGIPDHRDAAVMRETSGRQPPPNANWRPVGDWTEDGPNGFLVRLLNNLEQVVTGTDSPTLGKTILENRPEGGYRALDQLESVIPAEAGIQSFLSYLTTHAWVDTKVVKPQPVNGRPLRWFDIDEAHQKNGGRTVINERSQWDRVPSVDIAWKRDFLYAYKQLRLGTSADVGAYGEGSVELQPRSPIAVPSASEMVLAAQMAGLLGTYLHVWEGNLGFDSGFGFASQSIEGLQNVGGVIQLEGTYDSYSYPDRATTDSPWVRTRVDYGSSYGTSQRPWFGTYRDGSLDWPGPLGELRDTPPITSGQAVGISEVIGEWRNVFISGLTWMLFDLGISQLIPVWEDVQEDGFLDGPEYSTENGMRKRFEMEDANRNGKLDVEWFEGGYGAKGLTPQQKDVIRAMANPNTDLNDFNPDANLWKWVDKTDLTNHTTELSLRTCGLFSVRSLGFLEASDEAFSTAEASVWGGMELFGIHRDGTQRDFLREWTQGKREIGEVLSGSPAPYELAAGQPLVSYPEPQVSEWVSLADYDGQVGLGGIITPEPGRSGMRGKMFSTIDLERDDVPLQVHEPDVRGPEKGRLVGGGISGNLFPDGVYSEKDHTPIFGVPFNADPSHDYSLWIKPNWFPQAATRPHLFLSGTNEELANPQGGAAGYFGAPLIGVSGSTAGLFFVPARNNVREVTAYLHSHDSVTGKGWPTRAFLWGSPHVLTATSNPVHSYGISDDRPDDRIERGKWFHIGLTKANSGMFLDGDDGSIGPIRWGNQFQGGRRTGVRSGASTFRLGEVSALPNMNFAADSTFGPVICLESDIVRTDAPVIAGGGNIEGVDANGPMTMMYLRNAAKLGRYYKEGGSGYEIEDGAVFLGPKLPLTESPARMWVTWTEIPGFFTYELRAGGAGVNVFYSTTLNMLTSLFAVQAGIHTSLSVELLKLAPTKLEVELWQGESYVNPYGEEGIGVPGTDLFHRRLTDATAENRVDPDLHGGDIYYKVIFRNQWDPVQRLNNPLNETPFFDDITFRYIPVGGPRWIDYSEN